MSLLSVLVPPVLLLAILLAGIEESMRLSYSISGWYGDKVGDAFDTISVRFSSWASD